MQEHTRGPTDDQCNNHYFIFHDETSMPLVLFSFYLCKITLADTLYSEHYYGAEGTVKFKPSFTHLLQRIPVHNQFASSRFSQSEQDGAQGRTEAAGSLLSLPANSGVCETKGNRITSGKKGDLHN